MRCDGTSNIEHNNENGMRCVSRFSKFKYMCIRKWCCLYVHFSHIFVSINHFSLFYLVAKFSKRNINYNFNPVENLYIVRFTNQSTRHGNLSRDSIANVRRVRKANKIRTKSAEWDYLKCVCNVQSLSVRLAIFFYTIRSETRKQTTGRKSIAVNMSTFTANKFKPFSSLLLCSKKFERKNYAAPHLTAIDTEIIRSRDANLNYIAINQSNNR